MVRLTNLIEALYKKGTPIRRMGPGMLPVQVQLPNGDLADIAKIEVYDEKLTIVIKERI